MAQTMTLMATSELRTTGIPEKYRAVIKNSGLNWWVSNDGYRTAYEAEDTASRRLVKVLDDLRGVERTPPKATTATAEEHVGYWHDENGYVPLDQLPAGRLNQVEFLRNHRPLFATGTKLS